MAETAIFRSKMAEINGVGKQAFVVRVTISFVSYHAFRLLNVCTFVAELDYKLSYLRLECFDEDYLHRQKNHACNNRRKFLF
jgi:hypothetical protein